MCMKKKNYETPWVEIEWFTLSDVVRTSGGQDQYDDEDDDDNPGGGGSGQNSYESEF